MNIKTLLAAGAAAGAAAQAQGPCDIYAAAGTPCVAAHAVTRALYGAFNGALFQVKRSTDGATAEVTPITAGGVVDASIVTKFCAGAACVIQRIYDQSPQANHLDIGPGGGAAPRPDLPVNATRNPITIGGHPALGAQFEGRMGYRIDKTTGVATGNDPETLYMVTSGSYNNGGCCFDYGNAEVDNHDDGAGTMESVYFGTCSVWGRGAGSGPWVMADLENGLWAGNEKVNNQNTPLAFPFVTAMVKGGTNGFALKGGDATQPTLTKMYDGPRPNGYQPMKKQGAIILGIGGDNSNGAIGRFYEGVITKGYTTDAADDAVQANIAAAGYGK